MEGKVKLMSESKMNNRNQYGKENNHSDNGNHNGQDNNHGNNGNHGGHDDRPGKSHAAVFKYEC